MLLLHKGNVSSEDNHLSYECVSSIILSLQSNISVENLTVKKIRLNIFLDQTVIHLKEKFY